MKKTPSRSLTFCEVLGLFLAFTCIEEVLKSLVFKFIWTPAVPQPPPALPSLVKLSADSNLRGQYGGGGDAMHLGGWTKQPDIGGLSNNTFDFMLGIIGVKSVLDVGCGRGISTSYFLHKQADVLCVEGSKPVTS